MAHDLGGSELVSAKNSLRVARFGSDLARVFCLIVVRDFVWVDCEVVLAIGLGLDRDWRR